VSTCEGFCQEYAPAKIAGAVSYRVRQALLFRPIPSPQNIRDTVLAHAVVAVVHPVDEGRKRLLGLAAVAHLGRGHILRLVIHLGYLHDLLAGEGTQNTLARKIKEGHQLISKQNRHKRIVVQSAE